jgi:hypothetical protein
MRWDVRLFTNVIDRHIYNGVLTMLSDCHDTDGHGILSTGRAIVIQRSTRNSPVVFGYGSRYY